MVKDTDKKIDWNLTFFERVVRN